MPPSLATRLAGSPLVSAIAPLVYAGDCLSHNDAYEAAKHQQFLDCRASFCGEVSNLEYARVQLVRVESFVTSFHVDCARDSAWNGHPGDAAEHAGRQKRQGRSEDQSASHARCSPVFKVANSSWLEANWARRRSNTANGDIRLAPRDLIRSINDGWYVVPVTTSLRSLASMMDVFDAQLPTTAFADRGTTESDWVIMQIGGDAVFRGARVVMSSGSQVVGNSTAAGDVTAKPLASREGGCRGMVVGNDQQQVFFVVFACSLRRPRF